MSKIGLYPEFPFRKYLPSAFDPSMNIYETLISMREYLNEVIQMTNETNDEIIKFISDIDEVIEKYTRDEVNKMVDEGKFNDIINVKLLGEVNKRLAKLELDKADKLQIIELQRQINSMASIGLKGTFQTLKELQNAFPSGNDGIYIVIEENGWFYYFNATWTKGGAFLPPIMNDAEHVSLPSYTGKQFVNWNTQTFENNNGMITIDDQRDVGGNTGVRVKINKKFLEKSNRGMFIDFTVNTIVKSVAMTIWDEGASGSAKALYSKSMLLDGGTTPQKYRHFITPANMKSIMGKITTEDLYIIIAFPQPYNQIKIYDISFGVYPYKGTLQDWLADDYYKDLTAGTNRVITNKVDVNNFVSWNSQTFSNENGIIKMAHSGTGGNSGIQIPLDPNMLRNANSLTVSFNIKSKNLDAVNIALWNSTSIQQQRRVFSTQDEKVVFNIPRSRLIQYLEGLTGQATLIISMTQPYDVELSNMYVSDVPVGNNLNSYINDNAMNVGSIETVEISEAKDFAKDFTTVDVDKMHYACFNKSFSYDTYVDYFYFYSRVATTLNYQTAYIDQNKLLMSIEKRSTPVKAGLNLVYAGIKVPSLAYLCFDMSPQGKLYNNIMPSKIKYQDEDHVINNPPYTGMIMQDSAYWIPAYYPQRTLSMLERNKLLEDRVAQLETNVRPSSNIVTSPSGFKFEITVTDDGVLGTKSLVPKKTYVIGNSLLGGFGEFGMCASDNTKDYFAHLQKKLKALLPTSTVEKVPSGGWEGLSTSQERNALVDTMVTKMSNPELIVIQLGDNVNTADKQKTFESDANYMVKTFKSKFPKAKIVWVGVWYNAVNMTSIKRVMANNGESVADITVLAGKPENQGYIGQEITYPNGKKEKVTSDGVASHPGDTGMLRIAEIIINTVGL